MLSIKNRYNHTVDDPDATFLNDYIEQIEELTFSYNKIHQLNLNANIKIIRSYAFMKNFLKEVFVSSKTIWEKGAFDQGARI